MLLVAYAPCHISTALVAGDGGFVSLSLLLSFNRMRRMNLEAQEVADILQASE